MKQLLYHSHLRQAAQECAQAGWKNIDEPWLRLLEYILRSWNVMVQCDLSEAVEIMRHSVEVELPEFWYCAELQREPNRNGTISSFSNIEIYRITIALFETINYWCSYDANAGVVLSQETLRDVLKNGKIAIDWEKY